MLKFEEKKPINELSKKNNRRRRALRKNAELIRLGKKPLDADDVKGIVSGLESIFGAK